MSRSTKIEVQGFEGLHKVVENLGYNHDLGRYGKVVLIDGEERIIVSSSRSGPWQLNRPIIDFSAMATRLLREQQRD